MASNFGLGVTLVLMGLLIFLMGAGAGVTLADAVQRRGLADIKVLDEEKTGGNIFPPVSLGIVRCVDFTSVIVSHSFLGNTRKCACKIGIYVIKEII